MNAARTALRWPRRWSNLPASRGYPRDLSPIIPFVRPGTWETALEGGRHSKSLFSRRVDAESGESLRFPYVPFAGAEPFISTVVSWHEWRLDSREVREGVDPSVFGFSADVVFRRHRQQWFLFDFDKGQVLRLSDGAPFSFEWEVLRHEYQRHVPGPEFAVLPGRLVLLEEYFGEDPFPYALGPAEQSSLKALSVGVEGVAQSLQVCPAYISMEAALKDSPIAEARDRRVQIMKLLDGWPLVPSHGDINSSHVRIRNGVATLLDFGNLGLRLPSNDFFAILRLSEGTVTVESLDRLRTLLRCDGRPTAEDDLRLVALAQASLEFFRAEYPTAKAKKFALKAERFAARLH